MDFKTELMLELEDYNKKWPDFFDIEKQLILSNYNNIINQIEHIGSTSIIGAKAKPIIDILIVVDKLQGKEYYNNLFNKIGYELKRTHHDDKFYYYIKKGENIHYSLTIMDESNQESIERLLKFRIYLKENPNLIIKYDFLKSVLLIEHPEDHQNYAIAKDNFINEIKKNLK